MILSQCNDIGQRDSIVQQNKKESNLRNHKIKKATVQSSIQSIHPVNPIHLLKPAVRQKQKRKKSSLDEKNLSIQPPKIADTIFIKKLRNSVNEFFEPDLNEPINRGLLISTLENDQFSSMIMLSREWFFKINFDNDILDYTDRFYTNGVRFDLISPMFQQSPLSRLMMPYWKKCINYYGISLVQNIYTPSTTKVDGILYGDRPYSAYLYFGSFKISNDSISRFRQTSELDIGVIGPYSQGESVQKSFHSGVPPNSEPLGWEYQIKNDFLINYTMTMEKGIFGNKHFEFIATGTGNIGMLYTNLSGGFNFRAGIINPYFANLGLSKKSFSRMNGLRNSQLFFFITSNGRIIGYDATLSGGLWNRSNPYTLSNSEISRLVFQGTAGLSFSCNGFRVDLEQFLLSPEFHNGWWHKWVHICLSFAL